MQQRLLHTRAAGARRTRRVPPSDLLTLCTLPPASTAQPTRLRQSDPDCVPAPGCDLSSLKFHLRRLCSCQRRARSTLPRIRSLPNRDSIPASLRSSLSSPAHTQAPAAAVPPTHVPPVLPPPLSPPRPLPAGVLPLPAPLPAARIDGRCGQPEAAPPARSAPSLRGSASPQRQRRGAGQRRAVLPPVSACRPGEWAGRAPSRPVPPRTAAAAPPAGQRRARPLSAPPAALPRSAPRVLDAAPGTGTSGGMCTGAAVGAAARDGPGARPAAAGRARSR